MHVVSRFPGIARIAQSRCLLAVFAAFLLLSLFERSAQAQLCIQLGGATYKEDFNTLPASGSGNQLPIGFAFAESGTSGNLTYTADSGSTSTNNTYSYGSAGNSDRALGELTGATVKTTLGACFVNNTGFVIHQLTISYTGELWRLGAADANDDRLDFEFSKDTGSIVDDTATWTAINSLDFVTPVNTGAGAKDGNLAANRQTFGPIAIFPAVPVAAGATFYIRWLSTDITGNDDGLAIDDFKIAYDLSADFNQDQFVNGLDVLAFQRGYGKKSGASISEGDVNRDGAVDDFDALILRRQFGATRDRSGVGIDPLPGWPLPEGYTEDDLLPSDDDCGCGHDPPGPTSATPEPAGFAVTLLLSTCALSRRRSVRHG